MALKSTWRKVDELEEGKQDNLVSGTNIKTVNSTSLLGSGNVSVQETLVSSTNIKTINGNSILGAGNLTINNSPSLGIVTGTNVTNTTAFTKSATITIPANTISANTVLEIEARAIRTVSTNHTIGFQMYINTSDTLTGATLLGAFLTLGNTNWFSQARRSLFINPTTNTLTSINAGATVADDFVNTGTNTVLTFDETQTYYLIFALQPANIAVTGAVQYAFAKRYV